MKLTIKEQYELSLVKLIYRHTEAIRKAQEVIEDFNECAEIEDAIAGDFVSSKAYLKDAEDGYIVCIKNTDMDILLDDAAQLTKALLHK